MFNEAIRFFFLDTFKIYFLLLTITFFISLLRSFFPPEKIKKLVSHKNRYIAHLLASLLGIITPFCSCSAIPLFLGFLEAGVPVGVAFSFLLSSPMINEVAIILLLGLFGIKIATIYILSGLFLSFFSGIAIGKFKTENLIEGFIVNSSICQCNTKKSWRERLINAKEYSFSIFKKVWIYILIGIGLGALIHNYVPTEFVTKYIHSTKWYAVPLATLIGIPLYSNVAGVIPLVSVLVEKGVSIGTALSFMMAITGLSLPEFIILKRVMKWRLLFIFISVVAIGIICIGYLFNGILAK